MAGKSAMETAHGARISGRPRFRFLVGRDPPGRARGCASSESRLAAVRVRTMPLKPAGTGQVNTASQHCKSTLQVNTASQHRPARRTVYQVGLAWLGYWRTWDWPT